jgi:hypothetical protein
MYLISMSPFSTWSLRKWCLLSMSHLFVEDWIFCYWDGTGVITHEGGYLKPHSKISHDVHYPKNLWEVATYSTLVVYCATEHCFWEDQQTREDPRKWQVPEVLFRSIPHPAKSASEKPTRSSEEETEYQIPNWGVCLRYLNTRWTDVRCEECGKTESTHIAPRWTKCPAGSLWGTGCSRSCSCTLSGP